MLSDHLGSTVATTNTSGQLVSGQIYKAWGEVRYSLGTSPTKYTFTGQYSNVSDFGLMFYNARWYDPVSGRFTSADSIVPQNIQGWDRYSYTFNNPVRYIDPSGHIPKEEICTYLNICGKDAEDQFIEIYGNELHDLLWDTDVTWGDKLEWEQDGELQVAMMVLFTTNGTDYSGVLWGIEGNSVGDPIPFEVLADADNRNGHTTVHETLRYSDINDATDLPLSFGLPNGAYDGNVPYMQPHDYADWPEGTVVLTTLTFVAPAIGLPARVMLGLGIVDTGATLIGLSPNSPYWYNQTFGPIQYYPTVCMSSVLSGTCNGSGR